MKNLLILILLFFSFGAMAETNLRCEFNKTCYNQSCTSYGFKDRTNNSPVNISYHEGFFSNKLSYNSFEVVDDIFFKDSFSLFSSKPHSLISVPLPAIFVAIVI